MNRSDPNGHAFKDWLERIFGGQGRSNSSGSWRDGVYTHEPDTLKNLDPAGLAVAMALVHMANDLEEKRKQDQERKSSGSLVPEAASTPPDGPDDDEPDQQATEKKPDPIKDSAKLERQMIQRGWTQEQIQEAIQNGARYPARNNQTGEAATRYVHPKTGRSVVIDNKTGGIIHVGGNGFRY